MIEKLVARVTQIFVLSLCAVFSKFVSKNLGSLPALRGRFLCKSFDIRKAESSSYSFSPDVFHLERRDQQGDFHLLECCCF